MPACATLRCRPPPPATAASLRSILKQCLYPGSVACLTCWAHLVQEWRRQRAQRGHLGRQWQADGRQRHGRPHGPARPPWPPWPCTRRPARALPFLAKGRRPSRPLLPRLLLHNWRPSRAPCVGRGGCSRPLRWRRPCRRRRLGRAHTRPRPTLRRRRLLLLQQRQRLHGRRRLGGRRRRLGSRRRWLGGRRLGGLLWRLLGARLCQCAPVIVGVVHESGQPARVLHLPPGQHNQVFVPPAPARPLRALQAGARRTQRQSWTAQ